MPAKAEAAPAPPAEAPHGGCASCVAAGDPSVPDVLPWVAVALAVGLRSRRRRST
jgi:MYXO-CTERM domain-containing protein